MFKITVKEAARARKIRTPYQLALLMAPNGKREPRFERAAERLWEGKHIPTLPTLAAACEALDCELSDLVVRVNGKKAKRKG